MLSYAELIEIQKKNFLNYLNLKKYALHKLFYKIKTIKSI